VGLTWLSLPAAGLSAGAGVLAGLAVALAARSPAGGMVVIRLRESPPSTGPTILSNQLPTTVGTCKPHWFLHACCVAFSSRDTAAAVRNLLMFWRGITIRPSGAPHQPNWTSSGTSTTTPGLAMHTGCKILLSFAELRPYLMDASPVATVPPTSHISGWREGSLTTHWRRPSRFQRYARLKKIPHNAAGQDRPPVMQRRCVPAKYTNACKQTY
jgi:hypothetical protein